jgi:hypothetical protein
MHGHMNVKKKKSCQTRVGNCKIKQQCELGVHFKPLLEILQLYRKILWYCNVLFYYCQ